ncbi:MAG: glycosyltransferase family 4 protein, partial [Eubacterium sp.]
MKVLIVNPIIYTSETRQIKRAKTIKDTMIYDLCLGFIKNGAEVVLAAAEDYKPKEAEDYPFEVIWLKTKFKKFFPPNSLPFCPDIKRTAKNAGFDLIITSEVFSLNSLMLAVSTPKNLIVWHELAKHNKIMKKIPSILWYNIIARLFFSKATIVARSIEAKDFISKYIPDKCISQEIIDHGVNLDKFRAKTDKENYFIVSSQLI